MITLIPNGTVSVSFKQQDFDALVDQQTWKIGYKNFNLKVNNSDCSMLLFRDRNRFVSVIDIESEDRRYTFQQLDPDFVTVKAFLEKVDAKTPPKPPKGMSLL